MDPGAAASPFVLPPAKLKNQSPDQQQSIIFQFLCSLEVSLGGLTTPEMKTNQPAIEKQLIELMTAHKPSAPVRRLIARCFKIVYQKGNSNTMFENVNSFVNMAKGAGKNPEIPPRLAAIHVVGILSDAFGKQISSLFPEIAQSFLKFVKAEVSIRAEVFYAFAAGVKGIGKSGSESIYKDILKAARSGMSDKHLNVRYAAVQCLMNMVLYADSTVLAGDFENIISACFKALDGSNYSLRRAVANLLGKFLSGTQSQSEPSASKKNKKKTLDNMPVDDMLALLANGFIKAGSEKSVRVGIAEAYGCLFSHLGATWTQANCQAIIFHVVNLASHAKTATTAQEEVNSRECFGYILKSALEKLLNEEGQLNAIKELVTILKMYPPTSPTEPGPSKQALVVVLNQLSDLFQLLGYAVKPLQETIFEPLIGVSGHPSFSVRQAAAWSFRSLALATPANLPLYLQQLIQATKASHSKMAVEKAETLGRLRGHAICLSALVACIPHCLLHVSFVVPEEILAFAVKLGAENHADSSISLVCQEVSWTLLASLTCLGPSFIKAHLGKYFQLFQSIFSKNSKDASMTDEAWKNNVRARECALACLEYFLKNCFPLLTVDLSKKVTNYLNSSLVFLALVPSNKFSDYILKMRLFRCFLALPASSYELSHVPLLRCVVEIFTTSGSNETPNSLFYTQSNRQDATLFGWNFESDEEQAEKQLQFPLSGALEFDPHIVCGPQERDTPRPSPVPPEIAVIDSGICLFEKIFPIQQHQTQEHILEQFVKAFKQGKSSSKKTCLQINIFTALMGALKTLMIRKSSLSRGKVSALLQELVQGALVSSDGTLRYAAAETLGRLTGVVGGQFVSSLVKSILDNLINNPEATSRAGYLLALGCVMRYVGGMGASSHLQAAVGILHSLSSDPNPLICAWAIHSLWIAIDSAGLMFQKFVSSTLTLVVKLFLSDIHEAQSEKDHLPDLNVSTGRLLSSLMVALGPELQTEKPTRDLCLSIYSELENDREPAVVAEAVRCIQQVLLFAPTSVNVNSIVPVLQQKISNSSFSIRKACFVCLRQLIQRDPKAVIAAGNCLEEQLYTSFDRETNFELRTFLREMIEELLAATAISAPSRWIDLTRQILSNSAAVKQAADKDDGADDDGGEEEGGEEEGEEEGNQSKAKSIPEPNAKPTFSLTSTPRWQTKKFSVDAISKVIQLIAASKPALVQVHFNLGPARDVRIQGRKADLLVFRLNDLIRIAFNAATSTIDDLSLSGLNCLEDIVELFAPGEDPDYEEHSILEQYQAQVSAALRPAFAPEVSPDIISKACEVTAIYIKSGVMAEVADLRRVVTLLTTLIDKFKENRDPSAPKSNEGLDNLSPHAHLIVKLAVLTAWAELYVAKGTKPVLEEIVEPYLPILSKLWVNTLCDFAEIKVGKTSPAVREAVMPFFKESWTKILEAVSLLDEKKLSGALQSPSTNDAESEEPDTSRSFFIIFALCAEALFEGERVVVTKLCLMALEKLLKPWLIGETFFEKEYFVELLFILNRIVQTDDHILYVPVIKLIKQIINDHSPALFSIQPALFSAQKPKDLPTKESMVHNIVRILVNLFFRHFPGMTTELGIAIPPSSAPEALAIQVVNLTMEAFSLLLALAPPKYQADLSPAFFFFLHAILTTDNKAIIHGCATPSLQSLRGCIGKLTSNETEDPQFLLSSSLQRTLFSFVAQIQKFIQNQTTLPAEVIPRVNNLLLASVLIVTGCPLHAVTQEIVNFQIDSITSALSTNNQELCQVGLQCSRSLLQLLSKPETEKIGSSYARKLIPEVIILLSHPQQTEALASEAIKVLVSINSHVPEAKKQGVYGIIVPTVISLLQPERPTQTHQSCLQQLLQIGKESPLHFKEIVSLLPLELKEKLERSIKQTASVESERSKAQQAREQSAAAQKQPTIQLKMNFSGFA